uniref:Retrotransposon Copia-like N-terminal domain-containing protein n=1 Tax=Nicotiana tabacum TaxID=4097 RepID=A0A1S4CLZ4_TOBAC|nr:PREDICTED: uncharacterized protein LOC107820220 [Nicotiana tabacum]XP_016501948.1 PREDICTED: uncharacterized protein LOC107820220 [Nicotiana tabacum]XP_016501949.1 PREDICTED: uncharacterized protein LOC107820220 [Nicotiana tabacum]XP_016501950.1 PREDICTED: uncharacterized protein LOC107820220 [Nicotiana tabacum]XP_016501951.1 PREDICTED: uncharacterized protein LOC107820220 [Nicotiana tabacum]
MVTSTRETSSAPVSSPTDPIIPSNLSAPSTTGAFIIPPLSQTLPPFSLPPISYSISSMPTSLPGQYSSLNTLPGSLVSSVGLPFQLPFTGSLDPTSLSQFNFVAALAAPNVTNLVTIKLASVEDYLTWRTQFQSPLLSRELLGFVDGSIPLPHLFICDGSGTQQPNPLYRSWVKVDQNVRSWLFATLSREVLMDVHLLPTSHDIWNSLQRCYIDASQAKSVELKRQLTTMRKNGSMSIDQYLREAKQIADSLAAINSPVSS